MRLGDPFKPLGTSRNLHWLSDLRGRDIFRLTMIPIGHTIGMPVRQQLSAVPK